MEPIKDHEQPKVIGGEQKVILDAHITGETDELDPRFQESSTTTSKQTPDPGNESSSELI